MKKELLHIFSSDSVYSQWLSLNIKMYLEKKGGEKYEYN